MKVPFSWLSEFIDIQDLDPYKVAEELTLKSVETSVSKWDLDLDGVVYAKVVEKKKHPTRDLSVYKVKAGEDLYLQVVSADKSLEEGKGVLLALPNSRVGSMCISARDFDGITSQGMLLSAKELGLEDQSEGVLAFDEDIKPGTSAYDLLGFGEYILEIEPTPNRGDLLSVKGLAREIGALFGLRKKERKYPEYEDFGELDIRIESKDCKRYRGAIIEGIKVKPSPLWLRRRLWQCGIRAINNVVDITNYIMLLEGQPLHAFDLKTISFPVFVRDAYEGEKIRTLMGTEKDLRPINLLIADREKPLALAGVVGGLESSVKEDTNSILLESAYFDPYRIRKSARSLGLQTDSSYRFERNVDIEGVKRAQDLAIGLLLDIAGGELKAIKDVYPEPYEPKKVFLSLEKYRRYSGRDFDREEISRILSSLDIPHQTLRCGVEVYIPPHRSFDMQRDVDVIEEVLRVIGYADIKAEPLRIPSRPSKIESLEERIRDFMVCRGFSEVITFSFEEKDLYELLSLPEPQLEILNPLNRSQRFLRTSLIPSLLRVCIENTRNYNYNMAIFELGKVFTEEGEETRLAFLMTGTKRLFPEEEYSPYDAIGLVQDLLNLYSEGYTSQASRFPFFHPNLQRLYLVKDEPIAYVGVLNPILQEKLELKHKVILGELKVKGLKEVKRAYKPLSTFPPAIRDITLLMDKEVDVDKLIFHIRSTELVEEVKMFSLYTDPRLGEGKKSVSLRLVFRSKVGTLSDQEVNEIVNKLLVDLEEKFGAKLR
ncbi:MAG: phenylalanine--tRNA ligase subunit beta [Aquificota bacterium]|nr:phenylalanine--tRNA ligase subunit beta [Aquificaceae bacterium]MDM7267436.1 phenylalanine--tRNA ligase subunit beta [Aquificaceae bacterium]QWK12927.1 MAG: phenylalanine--tRNA ligase subunit beta [Aquificota bacterium]HAV39470.1 phenylalanine--tRNA ligase subunit beta [Aquificaceae bacterium]